MYVESINVAGYRSLYQVTLRPGQLTVLTGPNNGGKTNFMEALDFLGETHRHGLEVAINRKGGIENIAFRRMRRTRRPITFDVSLFFEQAEIDRYIRRRTKGKRSRRPKGPYRVRHRFEISASSQAIEADYSVRHELLEIIRLTERGRNEVFPDGVVLRFARQGQEPPDIVLNGDDELTYPFGETVLLEYLKSRIRQNTTLLTEMRFFNPLLEEVSASLSAIRLFQFSPLECRRPGVPTPNADLDRYGLNLPAIVGFMQTQDPMGWTGVLESMQRIVPDLQEIKTVFTPDRRLTLQFVERGIRRAWSSEDVSDGTVKSLALFTALFDRRSRLIMVEEPENAVHPWVVRNFVDACRAASKQVILTTHSPALLAYVKPEEVVVTWKEQGRTQMSPLTELDHDAQRLWEEGSTSLFDLLDSGLVSQSVPPSE